MTGEPVLNSQTPAQEGIGGTEIAIPTERQTKQLTIGWPVLNSQTLAEEAIIDSDSDGIL